MSVTCLAVEKPGWKMRAYSFRLSELGIGGDQAALDGAAAHRFRIDPFAVVRNANQYARARMPRGKMDGRRRAFAMRSTSLRRANAVVHAVADQMHQRIAQLIDDRFVELGIGAFHRELDILAQIARQIVDQPAEFLEGARIGSMRMFIELSRKAEVNRSISSETAAKSGSSLRDGDLAESCLNRNQFAHQVDELVELDGRDPQARRVVRVVVAAAASRGRSLLLKRRAPLCRLRAQPLSDVVGEAAFNRQLATVFHKDEDIADRFRVGCGGQHHLPAHITALRV